MASLLIPDPALPMVPPRKRWTRQEVAYLEGQGMFDGQHYELVEGDLINKMGKKWPHSITAGRLIRWANSFFGEDMVYAEPSIDVHPADLPTSEPEPDVAILKRAGTEMNHIPRPEDIALLVEVSDTSLRFDLEVKARLYARADIAEYWVIDVVSQRLIIHREPRDGAYQSVEVFGTEASVSPLGKPEAPLAVATLFPA